MATRVGWSRQQLLVAFGLYCQMPFGKIDSRNPEIIKLAKRIGRTPSALAMKMTNIASLDPVITSSGRSGLSGASAADRAMWHEMENNWEQFAMEAQHVLAAPADLDGAGNVTDDAEVDELVDYQGRTKKALATIRIGQNFFRRSVLSAYNYRCCITGLAVPTLLIASHIVPWRAASENRLNPRNGLCLSALHDKAFDVGIMTISKNMTIKVSTKYAKSKDDFFSSALMCYDGKAISVPEKFSPSMDFLAYHRKHVFMG